MDQGRRATADAPAGAEVGTGNGQAGSPTDTGGRSRGGALEAVQELRPLIKDSEHKEITGPSGKSYQIELMVVWDNKPGGNLRIVVSIDDGGFSAIKPLIRDFIVALDGAFVGE